MSWVTTSTKRIRIMEVPRNEGIPQAVLEALKGLEIPIIFTGEEIFQKMRKEGLEILGINRGDCVSSIEEVMFALQGAGKENAVMTLSEASPNLKNGFTFEARCFKLL